MLNINQPGTSIEQAYAAYLSDGIKKRVQNTEDKDSFDQVLKQKITTEESQIRFSKHASERLRDRGIELSKDQMEKLNEGVRQAGSKGIKDTLVVVDELSFIVNVPNNMVVTAMNKSDDTENVFTNIDGAVLL